MTDFNTLEHLDTNICHGALPFQDLPIVDFPKDLPDKNNPSSIFTINLPEQYVNALEEFQATQDVPLDELTDLHKCGINKESNTELVINLIENITSDIKKQIPEKCDVEKITRSVTCSTDRSRNEHWFHTDLPSQGTYRVSVVLKGPSTAFFKGYYTVNDRGGAGIRNADYENGEVISPITGLEGAVWSREFGAHSAPIAPYNAERLFVLYSVYCTNYVSDGGFYGF